MGKNYIVKQIVKTIGCNVELNNLSPHRKEVIWSIVSTALQKDLFSK